VRHDKPWALAMVILFSLALAGWPVSIHAQIAGALTVSAFFDGLDGSIKKLEQSGHSLLDHGNVVAGQQQVVMAGTLRATVEQARSACADSMNKTFDQVDAERQNSFRNLQHLVDQGEEILGKTAQDAQALIYSTSTQANALLDRMPFAKRRPVYFGSVSKNVLTALNPSPADLELLGFHLSDESLKSHPPQVKINGVAIPNERISARYDRLEIQFPVTLRKSLQLENSACNPTKAFTLELRVFSTDWPNLSRFVDWFVDESSFRDFVAPGRPLYEITLMADGKEVHDGSAVDSFAVSSGYVSWDCEQTVNPLVQFAAKEDGARVLTAQASFQQMDGRYNNPGPPSVQFSGPNASASGSVTGTNKDGAIIKNCPGGGHGVLVLTGTYQHPVHSEEKYSFSNVGAFGRDVSVTTPAKESVQLQTVHIEIRRKGCPNIVDQMDFPVADLNLRGVDQTSRNGYFVARYEKGQIVVKGTALLD
jgi:hypothetical protein